MIDMTRILIIDDDPEVRATLTAILEAEGFCLFTADCGLEGVRLARQHRPDLILCDITMPQVDGHEVLLRLLADEGTASIPFIFVTAKTHHIDIRNGMNLGADDYLTKPISLPDLLGAVQARLKKQTKHGNQSQKLDFASAEPLKALGLTAREAEVLLWVAQGKSSPEISLILQISTATTKKHLEHIFQKLGVENRSSAMLLALETLGKKGKPGAP